MTTRIKLRRDTYQNWYDHNPTLALGEPGYDTTNNQVKVGDGTTAWRALDPLTAALGDLVVAGSTITSPEGVHQDLVLSTVDTGPTTHDWTFGLDGTLTLPGDETITDTKVTNWDTAYGWGDHSIAGYVTGTPWTGAGYLTAEADTLDSVTTRGNTTTNDITVGDLTVGGEIKTAAGTGNVVVEANDGTARTWTFGGDGRTTFPATTVPATSMGAAGDKLGMVAFDDSYMYYCTADYVEAGGARPAQADIWKRVSYDVGIWD